MYIINYNNSVEIVKNVNSITSEYGKRVLSVNSLIDENVTIVE